MTSKTELKNKESNCCGGQECQTEVTKVESPVYSPDVDIVETDDGVELTFDMPGVDQEHLEISIEKDVLTVVGHAEISEEAEYEYLYREFRGGDYRRAFRLPEAVDAQHVEATIKQGILTISIPKSKRQTVAVKTV
ncbi:MAG: Hsp20/alpha crystallin family protein [Planctomycetaceae bacterium]|nr:Hsp20/alpha crystallin family protein [Planctomycetaceae bacterium]